MPHNASLISILNEEVHLLLPGPVTTGGADAATSPTYSVWWRR